MQVAHLMVNYDIPWNPNRLEQRFGRIHRIGQRHVCHLWNLVAVDTREGQVFEDPARKAGGAARGAAVIEVFDVLGQVLTDASLSQLLAGAITGQQQEVIESTLAQVASDLEAAARERVAGASTLTPDALAELQRDMVLAAGVELSAGRRA